MFATNSTNASGDGSANQLFQLCQIQQVVLDQITLPKLPQLTQLTQLTQKMPLAEQVGVNPDFRILRVRHADGSASGHLQRNDVAPVQLRRHP
jgi:hypothetical protein